MRQVGTHAEARVSSSGKGVVLRDTADGEMVLLYGTDEAQALAQWLYDQFGILAEPSYDVEAERATELPDVAGMVREHVEAAHAQQAENRTAGLCPCGMGGCSDSPRVTTLALVHGVDL